MPMRVCKNLCQSVDRCVHLWYIEVTKRTENNTMTIKQAIKQSQQKDEIVHLNWNEELHNELVCRAEDYVTDESHVDAWGCDEHGDWRVMLDR